MQSVIRLYIERNNAVLVGEELVMRAEVRSHVKPTLWTQGQKPFSRYASMQEAAKLAGELTRLAALKQNIEYGDNHDDLECQKAGEALWYELSHKLANRAKGLEELAKHGLTRVEGAS